MSQSPVSNLQPLLLLAFRDQQRFAAGYSPLYAHLFGLLADWLVGDNTDPVVSWLVETTAGAGLRPFDVTLLLLAGLHRDVLAGEPAAAGLARYFLTVGVTADGRPLTAAREPVAAGGRSSAVVRLPSAVILRDAILNRRDALAAFIRRAAVQTN
jgi:hypothetical protein